MCMVNNQYYCEICGKPVIKPKYYEVEGTVLILCDECAKYGKPIRHYKSFREKTSIKSSRSKKIAVDDVFSWEIVENYGKKIRTARERMGLSQEDLARLIGEPVSFIRKIEQQRMIPPDNVIVKLEKALKISLKKKLEPEEIAVQYTNLAGYKKRGSNQLTLGDVVVLKWPKKQKKKRRN